MREHALAGVLCAVRDGAPQPVRDHLRDRTRGQHPQGKPTQREAPTPQPGLPTPAPPNAGVMPFLLAVATTGPVGRWPQGWPLVQGLGCSVRHRGVGGPTPPHDPNRTGTARLAAPCQPRARRPRIRTRNATHVPYSSPPRTPHGRAPDHTAEVLACPARSRTVTPLTRTPISDGCRIPNQWFSKVNE